MVAIILVNWNGKVVTLDCLASLQRVDAPNPVVVDALRRRFRDAIRAAYSDVILFFAEKRFAGGNNAGIARALRKREYILLLTTHCRGT
jgi:GT2 family glycosyltransferase